MQVSIYDKHRVVSILESGSIVEAIGAKQRGVVEEGLAARRA